MEADHPFTPGNAAPIVGSRMADLIASFDGSIEYVFSHMFDPFISIIVKSTNRLIITHNVQHNLFPSDRNYIHLVSYTEILNWFGLVLLIDLRKTKSVHSKLFIRNEYGKRLSHLFLPIGAQLSNNTIITYERYLIISKFIHAGEDFEYTDKCKWVKSSAAQYGTDAGYWSFDINPNTGRPFRVLNLLKTYESVFSLLNSIFLQFTTLGGKVCIDEVMTMSRSISCPFISYNSGKHHKRGIAYYMCNKCSDGWTIKLLPLWPSHLKPVHVRPVYGIVRFLTAELEQTWVCLIMDNYYVNLRNTKLLLERGIYCVGTVQFRRVSRLINLPQTLTTANFHRQIRVFAIKYDNFIISLTGFYDKATNKVCIVLCSSNFIGFGNHQSHSHPNKPAITITSGLFSRPLQPKERPHIYHLYNFTMNATDRCDNFIHRSDIGMLYRTKSFWKRRFLLRLLTICCVNGFIKFNELSSPEMKINYTVYRFRLSFYFIMLKTIDIYSMPFTFYDNRSNRLLTCHYCNEFATLASRTKQKCSMCQTHSCQSHSETLCLSCCNDLKRDAVSPFTPRVYSARKNCADENCRKRTTTHCALCLRSYCVRHLQTICIACLP